ncbi:MAG: class I SAM-dependent methyltransferase [Porticoccaceae bacterium]|jgi:predicted TPR repeat methyltransferase|tara:strand:- start:697 stop:1329 length:633 start_codon:yes stop_codon:yes gene_type:complete
MAQKDIGHKIPIHTLTKTDDVRDFYDEWADKDQYNQDMHDWNYTGPFETVTTFQQHAPNKNILIFDAGCGTGLVGQELKRQGYSKFHGADLSQKLLDSVPDGLYEKLIKADLNELIDVPDNHYDAVMCVGTFTFAHVKPDALNEFVRMTKDGGLICFTINEAIHEEYGFDKKIADLQEKDQWQQLAFFKSDYIASKDVSAWLGLYQVTKP